MSRSRWLPDFRGLPRPFWVLFAGTLVNRVGGVVLVFLAIYLTEVRGLTPAQAGSIMAAYGLGAIGGGPLGGALSDRLGRRPPIVFSLIGGGACMVMLGQVTAVPAIIVMAVLTGLLYEMYRPIVGAAIADVVSAGDRTRAYSLMYWAVNAGAAVAPPLGALVATSSYRLLFTIDGLTAAACGVMLWVALAETRPAGAVGGDGARVSAREVLNDRLFLAICVLTFGLHIVFFQFLVGLPIDMRAHGLSTAAFAGVLTINPVLIVLLQPWAGELIPDRRRLAVLSLASLLIGVGFGVNAWAGSAAVYVAGITLVTFGEILFAPASMSLVADLAPEPLRGAYQGTFALAFTAAFAAAPAVGGFLIATAGARWLWIACLATGCGVSAGFLLMRGRR